MDKWKKVLSREEWTAFALRALYAENGYEKYRMSKFEEYDVYARNKDFLVSESVITFTDTDGKLLALKPDVTISIIKNAQLGVEESMRVYYHENVYRISKGTRTYKEIMQAGLERLGAVDEAALVEVLFLAAKSLDVIAESNVLEVSHTALVGGVLKACGVSEQGMVTIRESLGKKDLSGIRAAALAEGLSAAQVELVEKLATTYGEVENTIPLLDAFRINEETSEAVDGFQRLLGGLSRLGVAQKVRVDFSVVGNMKYYSGLAFQGYVEGIPTAILSGGQYDRLMQAMGKKGKAVGFAVYLDELGKM